MRLIRFLMASSPGTLVLAVLAGLAGGAASTALLFVINAGLERSSSMAENLFLFFIGLAALAMITRATAALLLTHIGQDAMLRLRMQISDQILRVPLRRLEEVGSARLLAIVTDDVLNILNAVSNVPVICVNAAAIATCLVFLAWLSWQLFFIVVGLIVLVTFTSRIPFIAATRHFTLGRKEHNRMMGHLRALITGIKELKVNRYRRRAFASELEESAARFRTHSMAAMRIYVLGATWGEMLSFITIGVLVFLVPRVMPVSDGTLVTFVLVLLYLMEPLEFLMNQAPQFSKGIVALKSVEDVGLTLAATETDAETETDRARTSWRSLELADVVFSYARDDGSGRFVLGPVNLACTPGEVVFLTGGNGSGKTTLAKVLLGLYEPESGRILLDGTPVTDASREAYRQLFSTVFADFFLFDRLLGVENTRLDERAGAYLERLRLSHKVHVTDGTVSTLDLSQGQRKRLALLAAYLEDRPIFLFDEWAADQDAAFKDVFYCELVPELKRRGKAVFVISHDERYYEIADRVFKLDDGRLVEERAHRHAASLSAVVANQGRAAL